MFSVARLRRCIRARSAWRELNYPIYVPEEHLDVSALLVKGDSMKVAAVLKRRAALGSGCAAAPEEPVRNASRMLPSLEFGESLCEAFELFRLIVPGATLNLDRCILLVMALAERQLTVGLCSQCQAVILLDPLGAKRSLCVSCERQPFPLAAVSTDPEAATLSDGAPGIEGGGRRGKQQSLF
jgi:hypothetical protein